MAGSNLCHCERSEATSVIASAVKQTPFSHASQARPRLHACTTSATADLQHAALRSLFVRVKLALTKGGRAKTFDCER